MTDGGADSREELNPWRILNMMVLIGTNNATKCN